jgi:riboflavin synthase
MFTGIIEGMATIVAINKSNENLQLCFTSTIVHELKVDQSVSHNGICLTVEKIEANNYWLTAVPETILKTTIGEWQAGQIVNIERCLTFNGRLDGHIVQGHVDCVGKCIDRIDGDDNWQYVFEIPEKFSSLIIEKGSISINGTSLTIFDITKTTFKVAIIPYTFTHTSIKDVFVGTNVNIEFDIIGKYVNRMHAVGLS